MNNEELILSVREISKALNDVSAFDIISIVVSVLVSVKPPRGLNCGSGHETISQNLKYLSCSPREVFDTLGDGQKWSKVCK